jgi:class I lanthipeptide synthase
VSNEAESLAAAADGLTQSLAVPPPLATEQYWRAQSLAKGAPGIALLHSEAALTNTGNWDVVHVWIKQAASTDISAADDACLFFGAPALAFTLHAARADGADRYGRALAALDGHVTAVAHRRVQRAEARIERGELPALGEFDVIYGLSGIGAYLLRRSPGGEALSRVLSYLVRLTKPLRIDGQKLPGWWTSHDPFFKQSPDFPDGHGNFGMAHGITGPLALISLALRCGAVVEGHTEAIGRICDWLDSWRQDGPSGAWWPEWVTSAELRVRRPAQRGSGRPSWCYGTPGLARAQQLAGIATGDTTRQRIAEEALAGCLADPTQLGRITDTSLCHGWAGLFQTAWRAAQDAATPALGGHVRHLAQLLDEHGRPGDGDGDGDGLLEGNAGLGLALRTAARNTAPATGWDACLLIS